MEIKQLCKDANNNALKHGFWTSKNVGEKIALMHSELSEALDAYRTQEFKEYIAGNKPEGISCELADCVICICDFCEYFNLDLEKAIKIKMEYNLTRPFMHNKKC